MMQLFSNPEVLNRYLSAHSAEEDPVLAELTRHTYLNEVHPRMLSGHILGLFLKLFSQLVAPKRILEIGTFTGYASICLARGLKPGGTLTTIELNEELREISLHYFKKAGVSSMITLINGDARKILPTLEGSFDLVFMDANKEEYLDYYQLVIEKVAMGGYILADNVLWDGKVLDRSEPDHITRKIQQFNRVVADDRRIENVLLPLRDGIMVIKKL